MIEALKRLDHLLDVIWDPKAKMVARGSYDVLGGRLDPVYDGRWKIIRFDTPNLDDRRNYAVITTVTERVPVAPGHKAMTMQVDGAYAPIGMWLVEFMETWDRAQTAWVDAMAAMDREHESAETIAHNDYVAAHQEAAHKVFRNAGGITLVGGAQSKADPRTAASWWDKLTGKTHSRRASSDAPALT